MDYYYTCNHAVVKIFFFLQAFTKTLSDGNFDEDNDAAKAGNDHGE